MHAWRTDDSHWLGLPVQTFDGTVEDLSKRLPQFARRPFCALGEDAKATGFNPSYDLMVRLPTAERPFDYPVGIVSKTYELVQHRQVVSLIQTALSKAEIDGTEVHGELTITENGERMRLSVEFPAKEEYILQIADKDEMRLRLECFNSVDGSMRFLAVLGWLRFICANGLVLGVTVANFRGIHNSHLALGEIGRLISQGLQSARKDRVTYGRWRKATVADDQLRQWVDGPLKEMWGIKAAVRVLQIARTGEDATLGDLKGIRPTQVKVRVGSGIPGSIVPARDAFAVSQALAWIAGQRGDVAEQIEWRAQIPGLIRKLITPK